MAMTKSACEKLMRDSGICRARDHARHIMQFACAAYGRHGAATFDSLAADLIAAGIISHPLGWSLDFKIVTEAKARAAAIIIREFLEPR